MKNILIVSALPQETEYIWEYLKEKNTWLRINEDSFYNETKAIQIKVKVLGVGKVNAAFQTADAIHGFNPDLIINIGVAGGLADDMKRGSVAIGTEYVQVDMKTLLPENSPVIAPTPVKVLNKLIRVAEETGVNYRAGRIATGDFVLYERKKRKAIKKEFNPIAFDMETAAVAQVATAKGIDFVGIRSFSDMATKKTIGLLNLAKKQDKAEEAFRIEVFKTPAKLAISYIENEYAESKTA